MRFFGVLGALLVLAATAAPAVAAPLGTAGPLVVVGPGVSETSQRQLVRTSGDRVYIASVDDEGYGLGPDARLHMYRATTTGSPTAFAVADAAHEPHVTQPLDLSGGDARIDADGTIHVTYVVGNGETLSVQYQTFDTRDDAWGAAQTVTTLSADGDGVRGKVVSALALSPSGKPLVVTASSAGVSAWSRGSDGSWSRAAVADGYGLHPSLAFDSSGRAHLAWLASPYGTASIRYASRAPDGSWSDAEVVADTNVLTNTSSDQGPSVAFDSARRPVVQWLDVKDDVRVAARGDGGAWTADDPPSVYAHAPALYLRGDDRFVFLGHDSAIHPAYLSQATGSGWSDVGVFPAPAGVDGWYAYDGSASVRFDPLFDTDCTAIDATFFNEDSEQPGRVGQPDLYYANVTLTAPDGGCPGAGSPTPPPTSDPPPSDPAPPSDPSPPTAPAPDPSVLLGADEVQPQVDGNDSGVAEAFEAKALASGTVGSLSVYLDATATSDRVAVGLYADDGGHPGGLLAQADAAASAGKWNTIAVPDAAVRAGEPYWIAVLGTGAGRIAFRDVSGGDCNSETTPSSTSLEALPSTWVTGQAYDDCPLAAYGAGA